MYRFSAFCLTILFTLAMAACSSSFTHVSGGYDATKSGPNPYQAGLDPNSPEAKSDPHKGLSWRVANRLPDFDGRLVDVGCGHSNGSNECNPYKGDMSCGIALPLLCFQPLAQAKPDGLVIKSRYHEWSGGNVAATYPLSPRLEGLTTIEKANAVCSATFGEGWRVAQHHDGYHWYFIANNQLGDYYNQPNQRFWTHINDQRNGNCWSLENQALQEKQPSRQPSAQAPRQPATQPPANNLTLFFSNEQELITSDCAAVTPVHRRVIWQKPVADPTASDSVHTANLLNIMQQLLRGPTQVEQREYLVTSGFFPNQREQAQGIKPLKNHFRSVHWDAATQTVTLRFDRGALHYLNTSSCQQLAVRTPIERTLRLHNTQIKNIQYIVNEQPVVEWDA